MLAALTQVLAEIGEWFGLRNRLNKLRYEVFVLNCVDGFIPHSGTARRGT